MAEMKAASGRKFRIRYRGRSAQVWIYLGKLLRSFVYQNDWKVLPMAALIAGLVGMVIRRRMFLNMEGTLMGAFALVCVAIWNGFFNSIQVICRERDVIKREHRSGMHISSYIVSHMIYQFLLCVAQTAITLYVLFAVGVQFPYEGLITPLLILDMGISMLLVTYASDMLSLWVSTLAKTTTTAMTIMPFVLIFQLVFSGGMLSLPEWSKPLTNFTISNPGLKVIAAQADTNNRPFVTISDMIGRMRDNEIGGSVTVGQVLDLLQDEDNAMVRDLRARELSGYTTVRELKTLLDESEQLEDFRQTELQEGLTVGSLLQLINVSGFLDEYGDVEIGGTATAGQIIDLLASSGAVQARRDETISLKTTVGSLMDLVGEKKIKTFLEDKAAAASYKPEYDHSLHNVIDYWLHLLLFVFVFAALSTITLEFIDKDKR